MSEFKTLSRSVKGLTVLVTGAASGMGRATARVFAAEGANVAVSDISSEATQAVADAITASGGKAKAWKLDVADRNEITTVVDAVAAHFGGLDIVVNNAGISVRAATALTTVVMSLRSATSSFQALALPPLAVIASATACVVSVPISVTATLAPSAANTRAVARPMPLAAPVTRTVRPVTERLSALNSDMRWLAGKMVRCVAGLTRLAPIRREVKRA